MVYKNKQLKFTRLRGCQSVSYTKVLGNTAVKEHFYIPRFFMYSSDIREEAIKLKVAADWFPKFDCTDIIGRVDFAVKIQRKEQSLSLFDDEYLLWAEAKQQPTDVYRMLAQLLITIKQDAHKYIPARFVGCFDNEKIAFVEYHHVQPIFGVNDFDWTQTPSAVDVKSVETVRAIIDNSKVLVFNFDDDADELRTFIKDNFSLNGAQLLSTQVDKNNFIFIYQKWRTKVMPMIDVDWKLLKDKYSIYDRDFFLAELNIDDRGTIDVADDNMLDNDFYITFDASARHQYRLNRKDAMGLNVAYEFGYKRGGMEIYTDFWKRYKRPPAADIWASIIDRLDLLVPQDVRERKGAFFTPQIWVEKSQQYLADVLGADWQDEYYIWDCCAGTGNLLNGLTNKYNIWASTLDQQDVDVMHDRVRNGANLLDNHIFQFDFLNDDFTKLPQGLQDIINDEAKRQKLVIYINPPYAEAGDAKQSVGTGKNKSCVATENKIYNKYKSSGLGLGIRELFVQFFLRVYAEINGATLACFSTLKYVNSTAFVDFRHLFKAKFLKGFVVPANTFDNVDGQFPIGFILWNTQIHKKILEIEIDVYDKKAVFLYSKKYRATENITNGIQRSITEWITTFNVQNTQKRVGFTGNNGPDFQNNKYLHISSVQKRNSNGNLNNATKYIINGENLVAMSVYFAVRMVYEATWENDRDQFYYPNDGWKSDKEFQSDCLTYTLFHGQNRITSTEGTNHWIPFTEAEVGAQDRFESHFMTDFMRGKCRPEASSANLFEQAESFVPTEPLQFSAQAQAVFAAGREFWRYYHAQPGVNVNASLYDIKAHFQGRNAQGRMNADSSDVEYMRLIKRLRSELKLLADKIQPKVYEYGFLK